MSLFEPTGPNEMYVQDEWTLHVQDDDFIFQHGNTYDLFAVYDNSLWYSRTSGLRQGAMVELENPSVSIHGSVVTVNSVGKAFHLAATGHVYKDDAKSRTDILGLLRNLLISKGIPVN